MAEDCGIVSWWSPTKGVESAHLLSCCRRQEAGNGDRVGTGQPEVRPVLRKPHADMQGYRRVGPVVRKEHLTGKSYGQDTAQKAEVRGA